MSKKRQKTEIIVNKKEKRQPKQERVNFLKETYRLGYRIQNTVLQKAQVYFYSYIILYIYNII